jgi:diacylglycerol kinase (ATP)
MKLHLIRSLNYAVEGILHAARTQRHIRYHLFAMMLLLLACFSLGVNRQEIIILTIVAMIVIVSEMFNSVVEETINIVSPHKNVKARIIKDMSAGAVLLTVGVALVVGYFIISPYIKFYLKHGISIAKHTAPDIAFCAVLVVIILVIVIKAYTGKGHPLRGGMPSGHAALAFTIWVSFYYTTDNNIYVMVPTLILAFILSITRVITRIHSFMEMIAGIVLGAGVTILLFLIFY